MGTEIKLDDNCRIFYATFPVRLRSYHFEYIRFNDIKYERIYDVYFVHIDHKNKFKVVSFMDDGCYFDSFDEAEAYIFKEFGELKTRIQEDEKDVQVFITANNKRKRGSKKST